MHALRPPLSLETTENKTKGWAGRAGSREGRGRSRSGGLPENEVRTLHANPPLEPVTGGGNESVNTDGDSDYYDDDGTESIEKNERQRDRDGYCSDGKDGGGASGKGPGKRKRAPQGGAHSTVQDILPTRSASKTTGVPRRKDVANGVLADREGVGGAVLRAAAGGAVSDDGSGGGGTSITMTLGSGTTASAGMNLRVCHKFTQGRCTLSTCPRAHPGIRDDAKLQRLETKGSRGLFQVSVCPLALAAALGGGEPPCPSGQGCKMYHPYVRPSTDEIVARIYPRRNGERTKVYPSGASLKGRVVNEVFQGYGVYAWPNGDVFLGDWVDG
ncbi:unnamed protein product, partial [Ectocarpus sp. 8 AP-2014]